MVVLAGVAGGEIATWVCSFTGDRRALGGAGPALSWGAAGQECQVHMLTPGFDFAIIQMSLMLQIPGLGDFI